MGNSPQIAVDAVIRLGRRRPMLASRIASRRGLPSARSARLRHQHQPASDGDAEKPDQSHKRRDVPRLAGNLERQDAAHKRDGNHPRTAWSFVRRTPRALAFHDRIRGSRRPSAALEVATGRFTHVLLDIEMKALARLAPQGEFAKPDRLKRRSCGIRESRSRTQTATVSGQTSHRNC